MSVIAPRCHLCRAEKRETVHGLLVCDHCDFPCRIGTPKVPCQKCLDGDKSQGRGPSS